MADNVGIARVPTNEELQDYRQVGAFSPKEVFLSKLADIEAKFTKNHEPFDGQCAKLDFKDKIEQVERESERRYGYVRPQDIESINFGDLNRYGDKKRFVIESDDDDVEMQNVNNTRTGVVTGHTIKYVCKERRHGCSVFIPIDVYDERFNKKSDKDSDK